MTKNIVVRKPASARASPKNRVPGGFKETKTVISQEVEDGRDLGAMVSILTVGMQQLIERVEAVEEGQKIIKR
jgi:hypothetical protein